MKQFDPQKTTDVQLLSRYEQGRDQRAFAEIVRRHGPMVLATALRDLGNRHDAEDAFQATFLALAKAAERIRNKESLPAWLHRTARRAAGSVRRGNSRRSDLVGRIKGSKNESEVEVCVAIDPALSVADHDTAKVLDEEISTLPSKFQAVIVLCHLEGLTQEEAARQLSISSAAVRARLVKAREMLGSRLTRRGVTATLAGLTVYVASSTESSAAVSAALIADTTAKSAVYAAGQSAADVGASTAVIYAANEVVSAMTTTKLTTIGLVALAVIALSSALSTIGGAPGGQAMAGTLFFDNFADGDYADDRPVTWALRNFQPGAAVISSGELVVSQNDQSISGRDVVLDVPSIHEADISTRIRARVTEAGGSALVAVRMQDPNDAKGYFAGVSFLPEFGGSVGLAGRIDGLAIEQMDFKSPAGSFALGLDHDVRQLDSDVQLDVFGNQIEVRVWKSGDDMPEEPQWVFTDDTYSAGGFVRIVSSNRGSRQGTGNSSAIFTEVHVADTPIHLLSPTLACSPFNALDGDLDGDGSVGFSDFLVVSANFGNDVDSYGEGDVTCDGTVGFDDFLALSANFGQSLGDGQEVQAATLVPEPSMAALAFIAFASLVVISRRASSKAR